MIWTNAKSVEKNNVSMSIKFSVTSDAPIHTGLVGNEYNSTSESIEQARDTIEDQKIVLDKIGRVGEIVRIISDIGEVASCVSMLRACTNSDSYSQIASDSSCHCSCHACVTYFLHSACYRCLSHYPSHSNMTSHAM